MRKRRARGGQLNHSDTLETISQRIDDLYAKVLNGTIETSVGAVCNQLLQTKLRCIDLERRIKETEELEERISALERASEAKKGGTRWRGGA